MDVIERALNGDDVNIVGESGRTALMFASMNGRIEIVRLLLDKGIDPNMVDKYDKTALHFASISGNTGIVKLLLDRGTDLDIVDNYGTALMWASMYGHIDIVELLLAKGSDPNIVNKHGKTALMIAIISGSTGIVKLINDHIDHIALQHALQNLAMTKSINSLSSPLQYLGYDIMKEIMICVRTYDHGVHTRMKGG